MLGRAETCRLLGRLDEVTVGRRSSEKQLEAAETSEGFAKEDRVGKMWRSGSGGAKEYKGSNELRMRRTAVEEALC